MAGLQQSEVDIMKATLNILQLHIHIPIRDCASLDVNIYGESVCFNVLLTFVGYILIASIKAVVFVTYCL